MNSIKCFLTVALVLSLAAACKKDKYIKDTGLHETTTSLSTYDYLKSDIQFDTLVSLIDHFNLQDSVNKSATFFAFTDYAVAAFMRNAGVGTIDALYDSVTSKFITQYMFGTQITQPELSVIPIIYPNWGGANSASQLYKTENQQYVYLTSSAPAFQYYITQYKSIVGVLDTDPSRPFDDPTDVIVPCQTTGLQTSSGTLVNVFVNNGSLRKI